MCPKVTGRRREDLAERYELLLYFAQRLPEGEKDSPTALADFLLELRGRRFGGLAATVANEDSRRRFEAWVNLGTKSSLRKAAERAFGTRDRNLESARSPPPTAPTMLWPIGRNQRRELDRTFREGLFDPKRREPGRLFLRSVAPSPLYRVEATVDGALVGTWPSIVPAEIVEVNWRGNRHVLNELTASGWRDEILAYHTNRELIEGLPTSFSKDEVFRKAIDGMAAIARDRLAEVEKHMPPDVDRWKNETRRLHLVVRHSDATGAQGPPFEGELRYTMASMWYEFQGASGFRHPIR